MKWPTCQYAPLKPDCCDVGSVAGVVQQIHDQTFDVFNENVDGDNISESFIGTTGGLSWSWPRSNTGGWDKSKPKYLTTKIANEANDAYVKMKGNSTTGLAKGIELIVDPRDSNGRVCVVAKSNTAKQIGSLIPEDPVAVANPKFRVSANYGKGEFGSTGNFDVDLFRNDVAEATLDSAVGCVLRRGLAQKFGTAYKFIQAGTPASSDKTHTWPNRTGNVVLAPAALTDKSIALVDSNGDLTSGPVPVGGDVLVGSATPAWTRLAAPVKGSVLFNIGDGSPPAWKTDKHVLATSDEICDNAGGGNGNHTSTGATMTSDAVLIASLESGKTYGFEVWALFTVASATPDLKVDINYTSTTSAFRQTISSEFDDGGVTVFTTATSFPTSSGLLDASGVGVNIIVKVNGYFTTTGAGSLQFRWAQNTASADDLTRRAGSWLKVWEAR